MSHTSRPLLAVVLMLAADLAFAGMGALVKSACADVNSSVVVFFRSLVIVVLGVLLCVGGKAPFWPKAKGVMAWRTISGFAAMLAYFYALSAVPLGTAVTLQYTAPIFVALIGSVLLKEKLNAPTLAGVAAAFVGATLVAAPDPASFEPVALAALFSAVMAGFAYVAVRQLQTTDRPETIVFQFALWSTLLSSPALFLLDEMPSTSELLGLLGVGVCAGLGQTLLTYAFRYGKAGYVSAFSYGTIPIAAVFGIWFFGESPGWSEGVGTLLIVVAGVAVVLFRGKDASAQEAEEPA